MTMSSFSNYDGPITSGGAPKGPPTLHYILIRQPNKYYVIHHVEGSEVVFQRW